MNAFLGFLLLGFSMMTYAGDDLSINVHVKDPSFIITLPANPTTGYQWSVVHFDKNLLVLSSSKFAKPKTNLIGAGGQMHFVFTLKKSKHYPASTQIKFKYARAWELKSAIVKNVTVNFVTQR